MNFPVHSLLCHKTLDFSLQCLGSLRRFCRDPIDFIIHDDGSLTEEDCARLQKTLNPQRLIRREEADQRMAAALRDFPACARLRKENVMALKILDLLVYSEGQPTGYCDSDIFWSRPFRGLFVPPAEAGYTLSHQDQSQYCLPPWVLRPLGPTAIGQGVNAGLLIIRPSRNYTLEAMESFFGAPHHKSGFVHRQLWFEQDCYGWLCADSGSFRKVHPRDLSLASDNALNDPAVIGIHFTTFRRDRFPGYLQQLDLEERDQQEPAEIRFVPGQIIDGRRYLLTWLLNHLERLRYNTVKHTKRLGYRVIKGRRPLSN